MANNPQITVEITPSLATTTDGTSTVTVLSVPMHDSTGAEAITFDLVGYDFTNNDVASAKIHVKVTNTSGTLAMIGTPVHLVPIQVGSSSALSTASANVVISGSNVNLNVIGVTGKTIKWVAYRNPAIEVLNNWTAVPTPGDGYVNVWSASNTRWEPTSRTSYIDALALGGDLSGSASNATVIKLQNRNVVSTAPSDGDRLAWSTGNNRWEPTAGVSIPSGPAGGDLSSTYPNPTVVAVGPDNGVCTIRALTLLGDDNGFTIAGSTAGSSALNLFGTNTSGVGTAVQIASGNTINYGVVVAGAGTATTGTNPQFYLGRRIQEINWDAPDGTVEPLHDYTLQIYGTPATPGADGNNFHIKGQTGYTGFNGGKLVLSSGLKGSGGADGYVVLRAGTAERGIFTETNATITDGTRQVFIDSTGVSITGQVRLLSTSTTTSATGGGATALPSQPAGYLSIYLEGNHKKIPYYDP